MKFSCSIIDILKPMRYVKYIENDIEVVFRFQSGNNLSARNFKKNVLLKDKQKAENQIKRGSIKIIKVFMQTIYI